MNILQKITMMTSNPFKTKEFKEMGLTVIPGDIREVQGTPKEVSIHKALAVDPFIVVEDTIVYINNQPIVDWKFSFAEHAKDGIAFDWHVNLSYHDGKHVMLYNGVINCEFVLPDNRVPTTPHFDDYAKLGMFRNIDDRLLEEVKKTDNWPNIDPRARALYNLTWDQSESKTLIGSVAEWTGDYQE